MKVFVDGKEIECGNDVKVVWDDLSEDTQLHMAATSEGIILDRFICQNDSDETGLILDATASLGTDDLDEMCH